MFPPFCVPVGRSVMQEGRGEVVASHPIRPSDSYMLMSGFGIKSPLRSLPWLLRLVGEEVVTRKVRLCVPSKIGLLIIPTSVVNRLLSKDFIQYLFLEYLFSS